jgi:PPM family protein phosphatase
LRNRADFVIRALNFTRFFQVDNTLRVIKKQYSRSYGRTDTGKQRTENEDALLVRDDLGLVALADGVGGAAAGELASRIFVHSAEELFSKNTEWGDSHRRLVTDVFSRANARIREHSRNHPETSGMGCTGELLAFHEAGFTLGHVGDSRTYVFSRGYLSRIGTDHTLVNDQLRLGVISEEDAKTHPKRKVIVRAVGAEETLALDLITGKASPGDLFLLCSDGLTDMVQEEVIASVLKEQISIKAKVDRLISLANVLGGFDNITVALTEVLSALPQ